MNIKNVIEKIKKRNCFIVILFAFFVFMMVFHITHSALWGDEWNEYYFSQASIRNGDMYKRIIGTYQPPLYNFLAHFWLKINKAVLWFRCFNLLFGCASGFFLFYTLKKLYNKKTAGIALCVLGVSYQWVYCVQECSEYTLMLCCLFGALYFYVLAFEKFTYQRMICFIVCNVLAIYSQYGSVFVSLPLLLLFFMRNVLDKAVEKKRKIWIAFSYFISLIVFAVPLYIFFLRQQMENNQISSHTVEMAPYLLMDLPFVFGRVLGYFYHVYSGDAWLTILSLVSIMFIVVSVFVLANRRGWIKSSLIMVLWIGYVIHYFLVQLHIYAMVHSNESSGFFCRYSYFYIPIMSVAVPILIMEFGSIVREKESMGLYKYFMGVTGVICIGISFSFTVKNWNKTFDDQFASIWMENEGWKDTTYLYGIAHYGFEYYVSHSDGYEDGYLDNSSRTVDNDNLPTKFWAWRTNWGGDGWQTTIDAAKALGYKVIIYHDYGDNGQLAY